MRGRIYDRVDDADVDITKSTDLATDLYARKSSAYTELEIFPFVKERQLRMELVERARKMALGENRAHPVSSGMCSPGSRSHDKVFFWFELSEGWFELSEGWPLLCRVRF